MPERAQHLSLVAPVIPDSTILPLEARGLVYQVAGKRLVDGVDLMLEAGQKTVLLRRSVQENLDRPMDRTIRLRQAMVFQRPVLLRRSVQENLDYVLRTRGVRAWDGRAGALRLGRLGHLARHPARVLSGGEQQRLALARALMVEPEILFLDEPSASLDPASTLAVEELIAAAHARGTSIVLVTHDLGQARRIADEVVFVHRGRITEHTPADRFFSLPASEPARAYLAGQIVL